ncbi:hypothetical protein QBC32DRAFT_350958 [Pseudoneurospora amorphoporcata]|uniref:Uncharacterized protein n=1 Tax=Pseudoneurospora amorphoporcata TaxID=241081 RepID=A0AAN6SC08_9PEZI|nr:hypothetical protein QBC32DRAFT_350958 [Pseudoneurospora amorphoporcata]
MQTDYENYERDLRRSNRKVELWTLEQDTGAFYDERPPIWSEDLTGYHESPLARMERQKHAAYFSIMSNLVLGKGIENKPEIVERLRADLGKHLVEVQEKAQEAIAWREKDQKATLEVFGLPEEEQMLISNEVPPGPDQKGNQEGNQEENQEDTISLDNHMDYQQGNQQESQEDTISLDNHMDHQQEGEQVLVPFKEMQRRLRPFGSACRVLKLKTRHVKGKMTASMDEEPAEGWVCRGVDDDLVAKCCSLQRAVIGC